MKMFGLNYIVYSLLNLIGGGNVIKYQIFHNYYLTIIHIKIDLYHTIFLVINKITGKNIHIYLITNVVRVPCRPLYTGGLLVPFSLGMAICIYKHFFPVLMSALVLSTVPWRVRLAVGPSCYHKYLIAIVIHSREYFRQNAVKKRRLSIDSSHT